MKILIVLLIILSSFILTGCENNDENNNENISTRQDISRENYSNSQSGEKVQRISYQEYVDKYEPNNAENTQNNNLENQEDNSSSSQNETPQNIPANQLASYSTPLLSSSDERINNLEIVCGRLNDFILKPHESFSYNEALGPYGPDDGFEKAPILLSNGKKSKGYGRWGLPTK